MPLINDCAATISGYIESLFSGYNQNVSKIEIVSGAYENLSVFTGAALQTQFANYYLKNNPNNFSNSGNIEITGTNLQNQINNLYPKSNPDNFSSSGNVELTGANLQVQINNRYNISNPNNFSSSGNVENTGNQIVSLLNNYYLKSNLDSFSSSGNVALTGNSLQNQINNITLGTGDFIKSSNLIGLTATGYVNSVSGSLNEKIGAGGLTQEQADLLYLSTGSSGVFYSTSNPSNFISNTNLNGLISTGNADSRYLQTGSSGEFYKASNPANYINVSNLNGLISTGNSDLRYLTTGASGAFYASSNPSNYITNSNLNGLITTGSADLRYLSTGVSGEFYKTSNPAGYITSSNLNGLALSGDFISGVSISGGLAIQGALNISAGANITLTQVGANAFSIASSAVGGGALGGVTGIVVTGSNAISGNIIITGGGGTQTLLSGNKIIISSAVGGGGGETNTASNLGIGSGLYSTKAGVDLRFKSLVPGDGVFLSGDSNQIIIQAPRQWFQFTIGSVALTNMAAAQLFLVNSSAYVQQVDLSPFTGVCLSVNKVATAGAAGAFLFLGYRDVFSATAAAYAPLVFPHVKTMINVQNTIVNSGWFPITQAARHVTHLALLASGGDGVLDPSVGSIVAYFK